MAGPRKVPAITLVAPKGFEGMTTFEVVFGNKHRYHVRLAA